MWLLKALKKQFLFILKVSVMVCGYDLGRLRKTCYLGNDQIREGLACTCVMDQGSNSERNFPNFSDYKRYYGRFVVSDLQVSVNLQ